MGANWCYSNLSIVDKIAIIILDKYNQAGFLDIVLTYYNLEINTNQYHTISFNSAAYLPLYYIWFFFCSDLR